MRQQRRSCQSAFDGTRRRWSLDHVLAGAAGKLGPHMANHLEALWDVLQLLADIFAELLQCAAAVRATVVPRDVRYYFALEMRGQGLALGPRLGSCLRISRAGSRFRRCLRGLQFFQFQFELFQLNRDLLALASEDRSP